MTRWFTTSRAAPLQAITAATMRIRTAGERFMVRCFPEGTHRRGIRADVAAAVVATDTDLKSLERAASVGKVSGSAMVELENLAHLERIRNAARRVRGIPAVSRRERLAADA